MFPLVWSVSPYYVELCGQRGKRSRKRLFLCVNFRESYWFSELSMFKILIRRNQYHLKKKKKIPKEFKI